MEPIDQDTVEGLGGTEPNPMVASDGIEDPDARTSTARIIPLGGPEVLGTESLVADPDRRTESSPPLNR